MNFIGITDIKIDALKVTVKSVSNPRGSTRKSNGNERRDYNITDSHGNSYILFTRQNTALGMSDDFTCGLRWKSPGGDYLMLARYNGGSHRHPNHIEGTMTQIAPHIHLATQRYIDAGLKPEGYAENTDRYTTVTGALHCLAQDWNIKGLSTTADITNQPKLF